MKPVAANIACEPIDEYVLAFEAARASDSGTLEEFVPPRDHPDYERIVLELVRLDLEFGWSDGEPRPIEEYQRNFPELLDKPEAMQEIAFEEYRQRREQGQSPSPDEYAKRWGVNTSDWPHFPRNDRVSDIGKTVYTQVGTFSLPPVVTDVRKSCAGESKAQDARFPEAGSHFAGFALLEELGRGAFGRVFLARQDSLANRLVVLKISADMFGESQTLAQLQHTNIVPIYSVHRTGQLQAVCMPYYGSATLVDVLRGLKASGSIPVSGKIFLSTLNGRKSKTRPANSTVTSEQKLEIGNQTAEGGSQGSANRGQKSEDTELRTGESAFQVGKSISVVGGRFPILEKYEGFTYVDAVLWMAARLADGLAHAHDRGIIHRDLKPANVLLTDDGQPMLLDFNLSDDPQLRLNAAETKIGGTLPYMSPEQVEAFQGKVGSVDQRSDIYSLGIILFELLTGQHPFPTPAGPIISSLQQMSAERRSASRLSRLDRVVSPAVEAIVRKCLASDPEDRYQTARELSEDLESQLANRPLKHAPDRNVRERAQKWIRRHPRLTSSTAVAAAAAIFLVFLTCLGLAFWNKHQASLEAVEQENARLEANESWYRLRQSALTQIAFLNTTDQSSANAAVQIADAALATYPVAGNADWLQRPNVENLSYDDREKLKATLFDILILGADAQRQLAESADIQTRLATLEGAWRLNELAEACIPVANAGQALWTQRFQLANLLGRDDQDRWLEKAVVTLPSTASDYFRLARELVTRKEYQKAIPHLLAVTRLEPRHFWAWHFLGNCRYELLQFQEAIACYSACVGLVPDATVEYYPYVHRAMAYYRRGKLAEADADLETASTKFAALSPDLQRIEKSRIPVLRAKVSEAKKDLAAAERALSVALRDNAASVTILCERSRIRRLRGDGAGAASDLQAALEKQPSNESEWNTRGLARADSDPSAAIGDFDQALAINPRFHAALQNKAAVLDELGRADESLSVLNHLVEMYPEYVRARIGRAVLLARKGQRVAAHRDVADSLARDRMPETLYQAANVYALTSLEQPSDGERVIPLLAAALWGGFGLDVIDRDKDMDAVRNQPAFQRTVKTVREMVRPAPPTR